MINNRFVIFDGYRVSYVGTNTLRILLLRKNKALNGTTMEGAAQSAGECIA